MAGIIRVHSKLMQWSWSLQAVSKQSPDYTETLSTEDCFVPRNDGEVIKSETLEMHPSFQLRS